MACFSCKVTLSLSPHMWANGIDDWWYINWLNNGPTNSNPSLMWTLCLHHRIGIWDTQCCICCNQWYVVYIRFYGYMGIFCCIWGNYQCEQWLRSCIDSDSMITIITLHAALHLEGLHVNTYRKLFSRILALCGLMDWCKFSQVLQCNSRGAAFGRVQMGASL